MGKKALSVRQPWAWLIVNGHKPFENRTWDTKHRGPTLIHASLKIDYAGYNLVQANFPDIKLPLRSELQRGGIIGEANLVSVVNKSESPWFQGPLAFVFEDAQPLPFHPCRGFLGFFNPRIEGNPL